ncbi:MAG: HD domain-containing protein [Desulfovibrionaceae bacterium]|nr:HD domain-containing protein [Desulfovibrionaceae bacterium]
MRQSDSGQFPHARLERIVDFLFEAGMLRHTPRSGYIFLGTGSEDVAQHSFRVAVMSFALARMAGADPYRAAMLGLFHDLHEARTSDLNYMNQRYATKDELRAQQDAVEGTGLEEDIVGAFREFEARESPEARLAKDADQLDLLFNLKVELDKGNAFARDWIESALGRLKTPQAQAVAAEMMQTDHNRWWFGRVDRRWWVERSLPAGRAGRPMRSARHGRTGIVRRRRPPAESGSGKS